MSGNWIKIHRKIINHWIFRNPKLVVIWLYCLSKASWEDSVVPFSNVPDPISLKRGSFVTGREALHNGCFPDGGHSSRTTWRWLKILEKHEMLSLDVSNLYTVVNVCNYAKYQSHEDTDVQPSVQQVSSKCPANVHKEEVKKVKKVKKQEVVDIPKGLDTPAFQSSWADFLEHRRQMKKPATALAQRKLLSKLTNWGAGKATTALDNAVENSWQGVFEPSAGNGKPEKPEQKIELLEDKLKRHAQGELT